MNRRTLRNALAASMGTAAACGNASAEFVMVTQQRDIVAAFTLTFPGYHYNPSDSRQLTWAGPWEFGGSVADPEFHCTSDVYHNTTISPGGIFGAGQAAAKLGEAPVESLSLRAGNYFVSTFRSDGAGPVSFTAALVGMIYDSGPDGVIGEVRLEQGGVTLFRTQSRVQGGQIVNDAPIDFLGSLPAGEYTLSAFVTLGTSPVSFGRGGFEFRLVPSAGSGMWVIAGMVGAVRRRRTAQRRK